MAEDQEVLHLNKFRDVELTGKEKSLSGIQVTGEKVNGLEEGEFYENDLNSPTKHFRDMLRRDLLSDTRFLCLITPDERVMYSDAKDVTHFLFDPDYQNDGSAPGFHKSEGANPYIFELYVKSRKMDVEKVKTFFLSAFPKDIRGAQLRIFWPEGDTEVTGIKKY